MRGPTAALALACGLGCQPPDASLTLRPEPPTCRREPVSAVRVTLLGDFAPVASSDSVSPEVPARRIPLGAARSVAVEGLSARAVAAVAWTGPLPPLAPGEERTAPVLYGAPDSLCQVWGLRIPRAWHRATLVGPDEVLITGGVSPDGPTDTLERYLTGSAAGQRPLPLYEGAAVGHSATALPDGTLLVAGGARPTAQAGDVARQRARLYLPSGEPDRGVLLLEGGPRALHAAVRLPGGQVFLSGGCSRLQPLQPGRAPTCAPAAVLDTTVRYDAEAGFVPGPLLLRPRYGHEAYVLSDGRVVLTGGVMVDRSGRAVPALEAELIDPLAPAGSRPGLVAGRAAAPAALLPAGGLLWAAEAPGDPQNGGVLLAGEGDAPVSPQVPRAGATLTALPDGTALLAGGRDSGDRVVGALELYEGGHFRVLDDSLPRVGHAAALLPDGTVLLVGGLTEAGAPSPLVSRFIHGLRVPDATPPAWPLPAAEAAGWLTPRRPDRVRFDGVELQIESPVVRDRPAELTLLAGVRWARGELRVTAALGAGAPAGSGPAVVLHHDGDRSYYFLRLVPGLPTALLQVRGAAVAPVVGCNGAPPVEEELRAGLPLVLRLDRGELTLADATAERMRCRPMLPERGGVGFGTMGGLALFRGVSLSRE